MTASEKAALPIGKHLPRPTKVVVWHTKSPLDGWAVGDWAIHPSVRRGTRGWTVTHVPTGRWIPTVHLTVDQARDMLGRLQRVPPICPLADAFATGRDWQGPPNAVKAQIKRIVRAVGAELMPKAKRAA